MAGKLAEYKAKAEGQAVEAKAEGKAVEEKAEGKAGTSFSSSSRARPPEPVLPPGYPVRPPGMPRLDTEALSVHNASMCVH